MAEQDMSRRGFLGATAAAAALAAAQTIQTRAYAQGAEVLKVGLIGAGGRGTDAVRNLVEAAGNLKIPVKVVAIGDLFPDRVNGSRNGLKGLGDKLDAPPERCFSGWDNHTKVLAAGVDLVILASPPGFRPLHFKAAIEAGKHVFMEKPVAVDGPGVRMVLEAAAAADTKKLGVVAGTQRRHQAGYVECVKRLQDGAIGEVVSAQAYWNQGALWAKKKEAAWTDMEWQIRNWLYFTWLSGDHICEQHVHNLDVVNWVMKAHPTKCLGMGGRQVRTDPLYGHIFDHFAVEYEYPTGARMMSMCRQQAGAASRVSENVIGTKGRANPGGSITGAAPWRFTGTALNAYVQEHMDLLASIKDGKPLNEAVNVAESTLTAIMGRMSCYTGQEVTWTQALNSKQSLLPEKLEFGPLAVPDVAVPGRTRIS